MRDESGPAFPTLNHPGMSLRDWFASQALNGAITSGALAKEIQRTLDIPAALHTVSIGCYQIADAMLEARQA